MSMNSIQVCVDPILHLYEPGILSFYTAAVEIAKEVAYTHNVLYEGQTLAYNHAELNPHHLATAGFCAIPYRGTHAIPFNTQRIPYSLATLEVPTHLIPKVEEIRVNFNTMIEEIPLVYQYFINAFNLSSHMQDLKELLCPTALNLITKQHFDIAIPKGLEKSVIEEFKRFNQHYEQLMKERVLKNMLYTNTT